MTKTPEYPDIITFLESHADPKAIEGMARFKITAKTVYGVSIPLLRNMAKEIGRNHELSLRLWQNESRETRILAGMICDPKMVAEDLMEQWVKDFDSWEICDQTIMNLFEKTSFAWDKAVEWSLNKEEFVKRSGFVLMARLAVSDKKADDKRFEQFFPIIKREVHDDRNFVKKAVNWALRQIGKRSLYLNEKAVKTAREIKQADSKCAQWIAHDALRELESEKIQSRLKK
ncbi:MAG: DNA alkylation repair protein [Candidatus Latescibacteria bacterium]|nr:DNA alkylation repair protein [Candidatus Latescibacterota bacterium]